MSIVDEVRLKFDILVKILVEKRQVCRPRLSLYDSIKKGL